ncbi:MAG: penicillin-binding protein 1A [Candidatus Tectimicrobiota bacterium]|nr:MAG: penicillin-binding protein 1A [Candidatus Tectomicrobia bacterium]
MRETGAPNDRPRRLLRFLLWGSALLAGLGLLGGLVAALALYRELAADLPSVEELTRYQPSLVTTVYDRHGQPLADFFVEKRFLVPLEAIPQPLRQATVAVEDSRFYTHHGIDVLGILRALWTNLRAGEVREGASTITQQLARTLFLTRERTLKRKLREVILALRIERRFSKDQILEMYLNQIFYGHNAYGVEAAAQTYFGKSVSELTLSEAALIAGLPRAPNRYSPLVNPELSRKRRDHVLRRMVEEGYITAAQAQAAQQAPLVLRPKPEPARQAPYFVEYVRQYLEEHYGATALYRGGFAVHTTLDLRLQQAAERALREGLRAIDKRRGYRGPLKRLVLTGEAAVDAARIQAVTMPDGDPTVRVGEVLPGVVLEVHPDEVVVAVKAGRGLLPAEGFAWVREANLQQDYAWRRPLRAEEIFQRGDVIAVRVLAVDPAGKAHRLFLEQEPAVEGALVAMEVGTGEVLAMVGGYDFARSQFNRAVQAQRQPGSAFKPIVYAAALEAGMTPASIVIDAPVVKPGAEPDTYWKPENYSEKFYGPTTLRTALAHSRNLVTVRVADKIGVPAVLAYARRLGITSPLAPYLSLALGASDVTLLELAAAYGVFANAGMYVPPLFITRIVDRHGKVLEEHLPQARRAMSPELAYVMTSLLQGVIEHGTGRRVRALGRPAAGKTGTTNEFRDAWFIGYTPELLAGVWVGMDDRTTLGYRETGGRVASPIWLDFMREAVKEQPITDFPAPPGVRFVRIEAQSGRLATAATQEPTLFEAFVDGTQPTPAATPPPDLRRDIHRLDREQFSAIQPRAER